MGPHLFFHVTVYDRLGLPTEQGPVGFAAAHRREGRKAPAVPTAPAVERCSEVRGGHGPRENLGEFGN